MRDEPLSVQVAERVLRMRVVRIKPDWYGGTEVLLFFEDPYPLIQYSWDERSCNAMMHRNGVDGSDGTAETLPAFDSDMSRAWEVVEWINRHRETVDWEKWTRAIATGCRFEMMTEEEAATAICRAALAAAVSV